MNIAWEEIIQYTENHLPPEPPHLLEIRRHTRWNTTYPQMISSPAQGRFLSFISKMVRPHKILELGTFTGYSTLCLTEGLAEKGKIITLDYNSETNRIANYFFHKLEPHRICLLEYDIKKWFLHHSEHEFDIIFIDADKENYPFYLYQSLKRLRTDGILMLDNMFWKGLVIENSIGDACAGILKSLTMEIMNNPYIEPVWVPLRDGMLICRKKT